MGEKRMNYSFGSKHNPVTVYEM
uniref:Uncharacterized protein n=1 Tax=Anguilla anguilla TaxID=7936 RepID=A0A0E9XX51_ANGAN